MEYSTGTLHYYKIASDGLPTEITTARSNTGYTNVSGFVIYKDRMYAMSNSVYPPQLISCQWDSITYKVSACTSTGITISDNGYATMALYDNYLYYLANSSNSGIKYSIIYNNGSLSSPQTVTTNLPTDGLYGFSIYNNYVYPLGSGSGYYCNISSATVFSGCTSFYNPSIRSLVIRNGRAYWVTENAELKYGTVNADGSITGGAIQKTHSGYTLYRIIIKKNSLYIYNTN